MGMYDTIMVPCPACSVQAEFQSKGGDCKLETYALEDAPDDVLLDVNRHGPTSCVKCSTLFRVEISGQSPRSTLTARSVVVSSSRCCALDCGKFCHSAKGVELPFCEEHMKAEALLRAWEEIT